MFEVILELLELKGHMVVLYIQKEDRFLHQKLKCLRRGKYSTLTWMDCFLFIHSTL